jgi:hypothetical protein
MSAGEKAQFICYGIVMVAIIVIHCSWSSMLRKRPKQFPAIAKRLGLAFRPDKDFALAKEWHFLDALSGCQEIKYAFNVLEGDYSGRHVLIFDYHYKDNSRNGWAAQMKDRTIMILKMEGASFPKLFIDPQITHQIRFESAEFSRIYGVVSDDKKFAYDVCNPQMIEFLLHNPGLCPRLEINGPAIVVNFGKLFDPDFFEFELQRLVKIRSLMPEYLFEKT